MKKIEIKVKNNNFDYSIVIGNNILDILPKKIKILCPNAQKIAIVTDKNVPSKFKKKIRKMLKSYEVFIFEYDSSEKTKSFSQTKNLLEKWRRKFALILSKHLTQLLHWVAVLLSTKK